MHPQKPKKGIPRGIQKARELNRTKILHNLAKENLRFLSGKRYHESNSLLKKELAEIIIKEFRTKVKKGEKVSAFDFGSGYGTFLLYLKQRLGFKTGGVELNKELERVTSKDLNIHYGISSANPILRKQGKHDLTYSINFLEEVILHNKEALNKTLDNISQMTKKGGKSYHLFSEGNIKNTAFLKKEDFEKRGFRVDFWGIVPNNKEVFVIKLTKIKD